MLSLALYQPDIPQNVGAIMRLCACMGVSLDVIEPCGFPWDERKIKQSAMDYWDFIKPQRHENWESFKDVNADRRLILMTTKTDLTYVNFSFQSGDIIVAGSESTGAPDYVHADVDAAVTIPMANNMRSLNVGMSCAVVLSEARRQIFS